LNSRFPTLIMWGPQFVLLYNNAYVPILGAKHPWALGRPVREVWSEIWDTIGPMIQSVISSGVANWLEDNLLLLHREGFLEECYFTFSLAPMADDSGVPGGIFT